MILQNTDTLRSGLRFPAAFSKQWQDPSAVTDLFFYLFFFNCNK